MRLNRPRWVSYALAVFLVIIALCLSLLFHSLTDPNPFLLFFVVVAISGWFGGIGAGIFAAVLSVLVVNWYFFPIPDALNTDPLSMSRMAGFLIVTFITTALYELQRRTERALLHSRQQTNNILESIDDAFYSVDHEWRFIYLNNKALQMWKRDRADLIGKNIWDVFPHTVGTPIYDYLQTAYRQRETMRFEIMSLVFNEWVHTTIYPTETGLSVFFHSIHQRKLSEERTRLLQRITASLAAALRVEETSQVIIEEGFKALGCTTCAIYLLSADARSVQLLNQSGIHQNYVSQYTSIALTAEGPLMDCVNNREPVWIPTADDYLRRYPALGPVIIANGTQSSACLPLLIQDDIIGGVVASFDTPHLFDETERSFMTAIVQQCAQAFERARLYDELRAQRERLQVTLSSIGEAVIATNTAGMITFMNPVAQHLTGWQEKDAIGQPLGTVFKTISELHPQPVENPFEMVMRDGSMTGLSTNTRLITRDGSEIPIDDSGAPIHDTSGELIGLILVFRDITDRRVAEQLIEETLLKTIDLYEISRRLSTAITSAEVLDALSASSSLRGLYQAVAMRFNRTWHDTPPDSYQMIAVLHEEHSLGTEQESSLKKHPLFPLFTREQPALIADVSADSRFQALADRIHSIISFPLVTRGLWFGQINLYSRHSVGWTETELDHIQALVDQVATVLQNVQLFELEKQANTLKLRFLGMISHELRTPLTSIKGFASSLLAKDVIWDDESRTQFLTIIDAEADKLRNLIEQLLDLTSLEAGTLRIYPEHHTLHDILNSAMPQLQMVTPRHTLITDVPPDLPPVYADSQRLGQVLVNLVQNAAKFAPFRSEITLQARKAGDTTLHISVMDHGPGIPPEAREYVFEAFRQVNDTQRFKSGAGLGLAICKGLVESHGGQIWIEDRPYGGTCIIFTLPLV